MSGELGALIREAEAGWEQVEAGMEVDQVGRARLVGRARRTRAVRAGMVAAAAVVLVAAAGGGGVLLARPEPAPPVDTQTTAPSPSPSASPSPTPTPTPTSAPTPTETAPPNPGFAGTVTVDPHLPSAQAITPEVWAKAGSGWVLASYQESGYDASGSTIVPAGPQVVYLISPEGVRYQLTTVQGDATAAIVAWRPGRTTALAQLTDASGKDGGWARLDLVTGAWQPVAVSADRLLVSGETLPDGRMEARGPAPDGPDATVGIDADGNVSPVAPDVAPAALAAAQAAHPDHTCAGLGRIDATTSAVECVLGRDALDGRWGESRPPSAFDALLLAVRDDGSMATLLHLDATQVTEPSWGSVRAVAGTLVVDGSHSWSPDDGPGRWILRDGTLVPLPGVAASPYASPAGWSGTSTYSRLVSGFQEATPAVFVRDDLATGTSTVLVPFPASDPDEGPDRLWQSLTGCYVVP